MHNDVLKSIFHSMNFGIFLPVLYRNITFDIVSKLFLGHKNNGTLSCMSFYYHCLFPRQLIRKKKV